MRISRTFDDLLNIQTELNRLFDETLGNFEQNIGIFEGRWKMPVELMESKNDFMLKVDLPGFRKEDIDVTMINNTLSIKAKREESEIEKQSKYFRRERLFGNAQRNITLPLRVERERVNASYVNGILEIHCQKAEEEKPKQISIQSTEQ